MSLFATSNGKPTRRISSKVVTAAHSQFVFTPPPGRYAVTLKLSGGIGGGCHPRKVPVGVQVQPGRPSNVTVLLGCNIIY